jgi:hypothetical protein
MNLHELKDYLNECNPDALLADGFDDALIGVARRCSQPMLAVYDYEKGIQVLMLRDGITRDEAIEFMEVNVLGSWMGEHTPIWLER